MVCSKSDETVLMFKLFVTFLGLVSGSSEAWCGSFETCDVFLVGEASCRTDDYSSIVDKLGKLLTPVSIGGISVARLFSWSKLSKLY